MFSDFQTWWDALSLIAKVYWGIAIPFTVFFLIQLALTFLGGEIPEDGDADFDVTGDEGIGFQFITLKNMVGFFTIFGWSGITCLDSGLSTATTLFVSLLCGALMMTVMAALFYFLSKVTESGTLVMKKAIGCIGEVYLDVHANRGNIGKVQIKVQGSLHTLEAITDDSEDLKFGSVVAVTNLANDNILIITKSLSQ